MTEENFFDMFNRIHNPDYYYGRQKRQTRFQVCRVNESRKSLILLHKKHYPTKQTKQTRLFSKNIFFKNLKKLSNMSGMSY